MELLAVTSASSRRRIERARAWLESRERDEELIIIGATVGAANELGRQVASRNGAAFGWHRISLPQLVSIVAAPELSRRGVVSLTRIGTDAVTTRLIHRLRVDGRLGRYSSVSETPGFPGAIANVILELRSAGVRSNEISAVCTENLIRVDDVMESPKLVDDRTVSFRFGHPGPTVQVEVAA